MHIFFLNMIGEGDSLKKKTTTPAPLDDVPLLEMGANDTNWIPEALTMPPETTTASTTSTTTTEAPFMYAMKVPYQMENGTWGNRYEKMDNFYIDTLSKYGGKIPDYLEKVPITTENTMKLKETESSTMSTSSTTEWADGLREFFNSKKNDTIKEESSEYY